MSEHYILKGREVVPCDLMTWAKSFETSERKVAKTAIGDSSVSTVFLGLNHQWGDGPPLLFETLVFGGPLDGDMERYSTYEQAEAGHAAMCERVRLGKEVRHE
jgi:hypothetical protein